MFYNVQCSWARAFPNFWPRAYYFGNALALGRYPTLKAMSVFFQCCGKAHYKVQQFTIQFLKSSLTTFILTKTQWVPTKYHTLKKSDKDLHTIRPLGESVTKIKVMLDFVSCGPFIPIMPSMQALPITMHPLNYHCHMLIPMPVNCQCEQARANNFALPIGRTMLVSMMSFL